MRHFAIVCPPIPGHVDPLAAVGRALIRRGHRVSVFHVQDLEPRVRNHGLEFLPLDGPSTGGRTLSESVKQLAELHGNASLKFAVQCARDIAHGILETGPRILTDAVVDAVIADQNEPAAATLAEHLKLPFVSACTSLPLNREPAIPPPFMPWRYSESPFAILRNWAGYTVADRLIAPIEREINSFRVRWGLPKLHGPDTSFSKLAQIAQMPRSFDFPRRRLPATFHYTGPWFDEMLGANVPFPFDKLDGRPLIYGSIGTLQKANSPVFRIMAEACKNLDAQLVLSRGKSDTQASLDLPGNAIVVNYAPQIEILRRATATITHAGMNTTQQSLHFAVPLVALPLAHDQPAIAARLARTGAGIVIPPAKLNEKKLREALRQIMSPGNSFASAAQRLAKEIQQGGGADAAASIIEEACHK